MCAVHTDVGRYEAVAQGVANQQSEGKALAQVKSSQLVQHLGELVLRLSVHIMRRIIFHHEACHSPSPPAALPSDAWCSSRPA
jgi:hypothetical protein